jgi:undecaprenyl-diphosphatase
MIEIIQAVVLGIVQGLTEFMPISSSAHLIIVPWLLQPITHVGDFGLSFDLALHLGTLFAVLVYFWNDWLRYLGAGLASIRDRSLAGKHDRLLAWLIVIGTVPGAVAGFGAESYIEELFHQPDSPHQATAMIILALLMIALALVLWASEGVAQHVRSIETLTLRDAVLIGVAQAFAILPGVSRSGSTISMALFLGLKREDAARFSFLLGAPILAGAGFKKLLDAGQSGQLASEAGIFLAGFLASALVGYLCIKYLLHYLKSHSTMVFVGYRIIAGLGVIVLALVGFGR